MIRPPLKLHYNALVRAAQPVLEQLAFSRGAEHSTSLQLDVDALASFRDELHEQRISAMTTFKQLAPAFAAMMSADDFSALDRAITAIDFRAALALIEQLEIAD